MPQLVLATALGTRRDGWAAGNWEGVELILGEQAVGGKIGGWWGRQLSIAHARDQRAVLELLEQGWEGWAISTLLLT